LADIATGVYLYFIRLPSEVDADVAVIGETAPIALSTAITTMRDAAIFVELESGVLTRSVVDPLTHLNCSSSPVLEAYDGTSSSSE
jgi:hypothetical protein